MEINAIYDIPEVVSESSANRRMMNNGKSNHKKGTELKILSFMLNHTDSIPKISYQLGEGDFNIENKELFIKICELGKTETNSVDLMNNLCNLNLRNWGKPELLKLKTFGATFNDVTNSINYLIEQSLPFNKKFPKNKLLLLNEHGGNGKITLINAKELQSMELKPPNWVIRGLLPEGLILLAGHPKIGKSFFAWNISLAISNGGYALGYFKAEENSVLYIPYEDHYGRLQDRINKILSAEGIKEAPNNLMIPNECNFPKMTREGIATLECVLDSNPTIKFVVIDTLGRAILRSNRRNANQFQDEYDFGSSLQKIALHRHISILLVHHTTKMKYEDPFDQILGTTGLTASPDSLMLLSKDSKKEITLYMTGRDIEEKEYKVKFQNCIWMVEDENGKTTTPERDEIIFLFKLSDRPLKTKEIAKKLKKSEPNVSKMLGKMVNDGSLRKGEKFGEYLLNNIV